MTIFFSSCPLFRFFPERYQVLPDWISLSGFLCSWERMRNAPSLNEHRVSSAPNMARDRERGERRLGRNGNDGNDR